jgi:hypothetical protein
MMQFPGGAAVLFDIFDGILQNKEKYGDFTDMSVVSNIKAFPLIVEKTMTKTHTILTQMKAYENKYLELLFYEFFAQIFSRSSLLRVLDAYLLEGIKALHRYGVSLLAERKSDIKSKTFATADELWNFIKKRGAKMKHPFVFKKIHAFAYESDLDITALRQFKKSFDISSELLSDVLTASKNSIRRSSMGVNCSEVDDDKWTVEMKLPVVAVEAEAGKGADDVDDDDDAGWEMETRTALSEVGNPILSHHSADNGEDELAGPGGRTVEVVTSKSLCLCC